MVDQVSLLVAGYDVLNRSIFKIKQLLIFFGQYDALALHVPWKHDTIIALRAQ